jgi:hypothetical protein
MNEDGEYEDDIEKAKQLAMGIVARGNYDPFLFDEDYEEDNDYEDDRDGYDASFGGDDGRGGRIMNFSDGENGFESDHFIDPEEKQIVDSGEISRCYKHNFGIDNPDNDDYSDEVTEKSGKDLIIECEHKFPRAPKGDKFSNPLDPEGPDLECADDFEVGDGEFDMEEEKCWRLDPYNADTDGDGFLDEADLAGLGQSQLTWTYQEGDKVGLIVEGTAIIPINESNTITGDDITNQTIDLENGSFSGSSETDTEGNDENNDTNSETDFSGRIAFETTENVVAQDVNSQPNPYYKIAWGGLDTCDREIVEGELKEDLMDDDGCDGEDDYGYNYIATKKVAEEIKNVLETELKFKPETPQANLEEPEYSDYINVTADFLHEDINNNFVYYKWDVYFCSENEVMEEKCIESGEHLTKNCGENNNLENCTNENLKSDSITEGLGVQEIKFKGSEDFYKAKLGEDKNYFVIVLETKETKNSNERYFAIVNIPIIKNDLGISFYQINFNGEPEEITISDEICVSENGSGYQEICPIYTGQILLVSESDNQDPTAFWELNDSKIKNPLQNPFLSEVSSKGNFYLYFPVVDSGKSLGKVSLKALNDNEEEVVSSRMVSSEKLMIKGIKPINENIRPQIFETREGEVVDSENVLLGEKDSVINLKVELIPNYLENNLENNNIEIKWYLNNQEIDEEFLNENEDYEINFSSEKQEISLNLIGEEGDNFNLKAEIIKFFTDNEKSFLKEHWGFDNPRNSKYSKAINIKITNENDQIANSNSLGLFMASTYKNAPEYFIFIIKTAIILILFLSLIYSFNYWKRDEFELKK